MLVRKKFGPWEIKLLLAVTAALALAWVLEPTLPAQSWGARLLLAVGCLIASSLIFRIDARRQTSDERLVRCYLDMLTRLDHHDLAEADLAASLPTLKDDNPWLPVFSGARDCLVEYGRRADEAEHHWTSAEVRLRRLAADHAQIEEIVQGLADPVVAINQYEELAWANQRAKELFGLNIHEESLAAVTEQISSPALVEMLLDTRRRKSSAYRTSEIELTDAHGDPSWYRVGCRALLGESDEGDTDDHGAVAILTDISHERGISKRHAEFVSAASHEMKTPLSGIRAYVELLLDNEAEDEETRDEFLNVIDTQADRLQRLINNLLNLARIEAGVEKVDKQHHSLNELLEHAFSVVQPSAEQKQITLVSDLSPMYMGVLVDRDMLVQAAINLLSNAIKYTEPGGRVSLRSRMEENASMFEVEDTGVGLSDEDCSKVFEKFYRVKENKGMAPGTGLGLPLAKHIVDDVHGGSLTVSSQLGAGSIFRISLPSHARLTK